MVATPGWSMGRLPWPDHQVIRAIQAASTNTRAQRSTSRIALSMAVGGAGVQ
jgi:hypothetical protein